jgi:hypothetical protein
MFQDGLAFHTMAQRSNTAGAKPNSSAPSKKPEPTASKGMTREELIKKLSANPRFKEAKPSGKAFIFGGVKR